MDKVKLAFISVFTVLSAWLGVLAVPVIVLVLMNIVDYATGIAAAKYRNQRVNSYRGFRGIAKKVCMWLLVGIGAAVDWLLTYSAEQAGINFHFGYVVACLVAVWLICNEIISILENISDIGVALPPFLMKIVTSLKTKVETSADAAIPVSGTVPAGSAQLQINDGHIVDAQPESGAVAPDTTDAK